MSPNFPAVMSRDVKNCKLKIRPVDEHISQLRFDFIHFQMGQPNRRTGICEGDFFSLRGGQAGLHFGGGGDEGRPKDFTICGQNSGQHCERLLWHFVSCTTFHNKLFMFFALLAVYYDIDPPELHKKQKQNPAKRDNSGGGGERGLPRIVDIVMNFNQRFFLPRMWEIRVTQIPFSQRAPLGCLQYFTGGEGVIQTFNFADNGRHLANQNYRSCIRQETGMCSIAYEPCDDQSFRISPNNPYFDPTQGFFGMSGFGGYPGGGFPGGAGFPGGFPGGGAGPGSVGGGFPGGSGSPFGNPAAGAGGSGVGPGGAAGGGPGGGGPGGAFAGEEGGASPLADNPIDGELDGGGDDLAAEADGDGVGDDAAEEVPEQDVQADEPELDDGSGGGGLAAPIATGGGGGFFSRFTSFFSRTIPSFNFNFFDDEAEIDRSFGRKRRMKRDMVGKGKNKRNRKQPKRRKTRSRNARQLYHYCNDRVTLPCVIEDFIGTGASRLSSCLPIHCGNSLCLPGETAQCRMETSVTPFALGFHFGEGRYKGSAEDNIGACLRYFQLPCL